MKTAKTVAVAVAIATALKLCIAFIKSALFPQQSSAIGIIGGADGPTAIFVASRPAPHFIIGLAVLVVSFTAWLVLHIRSKRK